jgi:pterin-4a-carbinolamine dehydratase
MPTAKFIVGWALLFLVGREAGSSLEGGKMIFVNYRRADSYHVARRLAETLARDFGWENVFFDEHNAAPGAEWPAKIRSALDSASAIVVVIGRKWLRVSEPNGKRRIDSESDWVRQEICTALLRKRRGENVLIIPALCERTNPLKASDLDEVLGPLCQLQAVRLEETDSGVASTELRARLIQYGFHLVFPRPVVTPLVEAPNQLTTEQEIEFISEFRKWHIVKGEKTGEPGDYVEELYRLFEFETYEDAWHFMEEVDERGVRPYNHHPRWQNMYNRVEVWLSTCNTGHKPSLRDLRLARIFEEIWGEFEAKQTLRHRPPADV